MEENVTNSEFAAGLRAVAEFLETHPEMPQPDNKMRVYGVNTRGEFANTARILADGGKVEKYDKDTGMSYERLCIGRDFGGVKVEVGVYKSSVCRKVRKMVEVDAWECAESILAPEMTEA